MRLIEAEVARYDWSMFACGCGDTAGHLRDDLLRLAEAQTREEAKALRLDSHVMIQSFPQEPAVPVAAVLMAALAEDMAIGARAQALDLLFGLVLNDDDDSSEACQEVARQGLWGLYADLAADQSLDVTAYAYEILRVIETDERRLASIFRDGPSVCLAGRFGCSGW
jgi:hypothetical protein